MSLSLKILVQFLKNFQGRGCFSQGAPITKKKKTLKETGWLLRQQKFIVLLRKLSSENPLT